MNNINKGFSLIELMVVIAIVALLSAVAVPSYKSYAGKAKMAGVYSMLQNQMSYVAEQHTFGTTTARTLTAPVDGVTSIVATPTSTGGTIVINFEAGTTFSNDFSTATVVGYTGTDSNGSVTWDCAAATPTGTNGITGGADTASRQGVMNDFFQDCNAI